MARQRHRVRGDLFLFDRFGSGHFAFCVFPEALSLDADLADTAGVPLGDVVAYLSAGIVYPQRAVNV